MDGQLIKERRNLQFTYWDINEGDASPKVGYQIYVVDESVLAPILDQRRSRKRQKGRMNTNSVGLKFCLAKTYNLSDDSLECQHMLVFPEEIQRQLDPTEK